MNQMRMQLDTESRNFAAATDDNIHLKAQLEALHSKNINLEAKVFLAMLQLSRKVEVGCLRNVQELPLLATSSLMVTAPIAGKSWQLNHEPQCGMGKKQAAVTLIKSVGKARIGRAKTLTTLEMDSSTRLNTLACYTSGTPPMTKTTAPHLLTLHLTALNCIKPITDRLTFFAFWDSCRHLSYDLL